MSEVQNLTDEQDAKIIAYFHESDIIKALVELLSAADTKGQFKFSETGIVHIEQNSKETLLIHCELKTSCLYEYVYCSSFPKVFLNFDMKDLKTQFSKVPKKKAFQLIKNPYNNIVPIITEEKVEHPLQLLKIPELEEVDPPEFQGDEQYPLCRVKITDFAAMCKILGKMKDATVQILAYEHGVIFKVIHKNSEPAFYPYLRNYPAPKPPSSVSSVNISSNDSNTGSSSVLIPHSSSTSSSFPSTSSSTSSTSNSNSNSNGKLKLRIKLPTAQPKLIGSMTIMPSILKPFGKINNLNPNGLLSFYMESFDLGEGMVTFFKIMGCIGNYGLIRIYFRPESSN